MTLEKVIRWGVDYDGSTRSAALIRVGLVFLIWARFGFEMQPFHDPHPPDYLFRVVFFLVTFCMAIGFLTRYAVAGTAIALALIYFYYGHAEGKEAWTAHHVYLLLISSCFVLLTPSGRSYSVDRWIALNRSHTSGQTPPAERGNLLGLRLISLQLVIVYFWAAMDKLDPVFLSGERFQHFLYDFYAGVDFAALPGFEFLCMLLGSGTVILEFTLAFGLLAPPLQRYLIPAGLLFHLLIYLVFPVLTFSLTMVLLYLSFLPADRVHAVIDRLQDHEPKRSGPSA